MGFAGARLPEKNDRLGLFYVVSLRQIPDLQSRDFGRLRKVEILKSFDSGQVSFLQSALNGPMLTFFDFGGEKHLKITQVGLILLDSLLAKFGKLRSHRRHP
jgi:hypothetical protein